MNELSAACEIVRQGGIIAYPTEAVFGLGCDPNNEQALDRIIDLKGRDSHKGFIIIASSLKQLDNYILPPSPTLMQRLEQDWPGPVTWILDASANLSELLTGGRTTIATRVSAHPVVQALCNELGMPLVSTSANISGQTECRTTQSVHDIFGKSIDAVIDGETGDLDGPTPIIDGATLKRLR